MNLVLSIGNIVKQLRSLSKRKALEVVALVHNKKRVTIKEVSRELNIPISTARKYLEELVSAGLLDKKIEQKQVIYVEKEFTIKLTPEIITTILQTSKENFTVEIIKEYGDGIISKLKKLGPLVKEGKLSIYDFADELGITYVEAFSLLAENGYI
ncbi:MAG: helix-turn-helix domain-containing protein [Candidatus Asgardarchaeia archaeon]